MSSTATIQEPVKETFTLTFSICNGKLESKPSISPSSTLSTNTMTETVAKSAKMPMKCFLDCKSRDRALMPGTAMEHLWVDPTECINTNQLARQLRSQIEAFEKAGFTENIPIAYSKWREDAFKVVQVSVSDPFSDAWNDSANELIINDRNIGPTMALLQLAPEKSALRILLAEEANKGRL